MSRRLTLRGALSGLAMLTLHMAHAAPAAGQDTGAFDAHVSLGAAPVGLSGYAWSESNSAMNGWTAQLLTPGGGSSIMLLFSGAMRPPTGEYPVVDLVVNDFWPPEGQFVATGSVDPQQFSLTGFHSESGIIVITSSSPGSVEGTFEFQARDAVGGAPVTVGGTFRTSNQGE